MAGWRQWRWLPRANRLLLHFYCNVIDFDLPCMKPRSQALEASISAGVLQRGSDVGVLCLSRRLVAVEAGTCSDFMDAGIVEGTSHGC